MFLNYCDSVLTISHVYAVIGTAKTLQASRFMPPSHHSFLRWQLLYVIKQKCCTEVLLRYTPF